MLGQPNWRLLQTLFKRHLFIFLPLFPCVRARRVNPSTWQSFLLFKGNLSRQVWAPPPKQGANPMEKIQRTIFSLRWNWPIRSVSWPFSLWPSAKDQGMTSAIVLVVNLLVNFLIEIKYLLKFVWLARGLNLWPYAPQTVTPPTELQRPGYVLSKNFSKLAEDLGPVLVNLLVEAL